MVNQKDVARVAGVSSATVSRYLNNTTFVSPEVGQRIQKAIDDLNYKIDINAQSLKTGKANHIAILVPGSGPFYWQLIFAIQNLLTPQGYFVSVIFTRDVDPNYPNTRQSLFASLRNRQIAGVIFFPLLSDDDEEILSLLEQQHEHVVIMDCHLRTHQFHELYVDNRCAGRRAAREFLNHGHRDFLLIHGLEFFHSSRERREGFEEELGQAGISLEEDRVVHGDFFAPRVFELLRGRVRQLPRFTAVFAENDASAAAFMRAAWEEGLECPRDYSIIGFDNNMEYAPYSTPSLTSFDQRLNQLGVIAATTILDLVEGRTPKEKTVMVEPELVKRESVGPAPRR